MTHGMTEQQLLSVDNSANHLKVCDCKKNLLYAKLKTIASVNRNNHNRHALAGKQSQRSSCNLYLCYTCIQVPMWRVKAGMGQE